MGTVTGVAAEAGLAERGWVGAGHRPRPAGRQPRRRRRRRWRASARTRPTSRARRAWPTEAAPGSTSVVTGILFLAAILLSPLAADRPDPGHGPGAGAGRLPDVHADQATSTSRDIEDGFPALLTIILMPLTFTITIGIGAGIVSWVVHQGRRADKVGEIHWLMWLVFLAFLVFFAQDWITTMLRLTACTRPMAPGRATRPGATLSSPMTAPLPDGARLRVDDFDYESAGSGASPRSRPSPATPRACWSSIEPRSRPGPPALDASTFARGRRAAAPRGPAGRQRLARHPGAATRHAPRRRRRRGPDAAPDRGRPRPLGGARAPVAAHRGRRAR